MIYFKLALRNAKRSVFDYMLYIITMIILLFIMLFSNFIAVTGNMEAGFRTASLPMLVALILVALVSYINRYMLRQRAKEFASYLLLGMEKKTVCGMFLLEFSIIGVFCFLVSICLCLGVSMLFGKPALFLQSLLQTLPCFLMIELLSMYRMNRCIRKMMIAELMTEKRRNQSPGGKQRYRLWGTLMAVSVFCYLAMLAGIVFLPGAALNILIAFIALPALFCVFAFYQWLFPYLMVKRQCLWEPLYQGEKLYLTARLTSRAQTDALICGIFGASLLFAACSFVFGWFLFRPQAILSDLSSQKWMGFLQMNICIIFIVIYFSILSLQQMIELRQQRKELRIMHYMGRSTRQLTSLLKRQIALRLSIPAFTCFAVLAVSIPFLNYKLNNVLPDSLGNTLIKSAGLFTLCFSALYLCYFQTVYQLSKRGLRLTDSLSRLDS